MVPERYRKLVIFQRKQSLCLFKWCKEYNSPQQFVAQKERQMSKGKPLGFEGEEYLHWKIRETRPGTSFAWLALPFGVKRGGWPERLERFR